MRVTRVFVEMALSSGAAAELPAEAGAHLARVLRARAGDALVLFNGDGGEYQALIEAVKGTRVTVNIGTRSEPATESHLPITLIQSIARGEKMDLIVQKATELGVSRIVPVLSERSVVRLDASQASSKQAHWQAVAASACEQCGRVRLPEVMTPQPLLSYLGSLQAEGGLKLVFEPDAAATVKSTKAFSAVEFAVGPEGGFAEGELEAFRVAHFQRAGLGPRILRAETAAIAAMVWLQTQIGDMSAIF
jgi:16S rRNA (uracil1498-N3)-methyltransferase